MRPSFVRATLFGCCLVFGLAGACGGDEFASSDDESSGGSAGAHAGTMSQSNAGIGGKSSGGGAAGAISTGGKAGAPTGVAGVAGAMAGAAGKGGGGAGGAGMAGASMGGAGMGGTALGPCAGKQDVDCLNCCNQVASLMSYEQLSYECACSEPCYALCEGNCNTPEPRSLACHRCVAKGLGENPTNLCQPNAAACKADPSCAAVTACLRGCL